MDCAPFITTNKNESELIDFVKRIELTSAILSPQTLRFAEKFEHQFLHVFIFGNKFPENYGFVVMPVTSCQRYKFQFIMQYLIIVKGNEIVRACNWHSNVTVSLKKHATKY